MATPGDTKSYFKPSSVLAAIKRTTYRYSEKIIYSLIFTCMKAARHLPIHKSRRFRQIFFDISNPDILLVSSGCSETFIISPRDKEIGKNLYIDNEPYDFAKMQIILNVLTNFQPKSLIDVGANIGTICIPAVKRGIFQSAIAIEPEPRNYSLLIANIHINGVSDKIISYNLALGRRDDENVLFELSDINFGDHRVRIESDINLYGESTREAIHVRSETFDKVVKSIEANGTLIWMDTQGFEGHILLGARNALRRRPPMCLEFWPYGMNRSKSYPALKNALIEFGYNRFYNLNGTPTAVPLNARSLDKLYAELGEKGAYTDLLVLADS